MTFAKHPLAEGAVVLLLRFELLRFREVMAQRKVRYIPIGYKNDAMGLIPNGFEFGRYSLSLPPLQGGVGEPNVSLLNPIGLSHFW